MIAVAVPALTKQKIRGLPEENDRTGWQTFTDHWRSMLSLSNVDGPRPLVRCPIQTWNDCNHVSGCSLFDIQLRALIKLLVR